MITKRDFISYGSCFCEEYSSNENIKLRLYNILGKLNNYCNDLKCKLGFLEQTYVDCGKITSHNNNCSTRGSHA